VTPTDDNHSWTLESYIAHNEAMRERDRQELEKQAKEYERRLESLNHENARVSAAADKSVPRELFDLTVGPIKDFMAQEQGRGIGVDRSKSTIAWAVAVVASLIAIGAFVFTGKLGGVAPPVTINMPSAAPTQTTTTTIPAIR